MTDELAPDVPLPPAVALPARGPLLPLDTNVARNTIPPHSVPIKHPISFHTFREITNFIRDNGDDWEEFYTSKYTTTTTDKTIGKIKKKKLRLPHPFSLDVLPSPTEKMECNNPSHQSLDRRLFGISHLLQTFLLPSESCSPHKSLCHKHHCLHCW